MHVKGDCYSTHYRAWESTCCIAAAPHGNACSTLITCVLVALYVVYRFHRPLIHLLVSLFMSMVISWSCTGLQWQDIAETLGGILVIARRCAPLVVPPACLRAMVWS